MPAMLRSFVKDTWHTAPDEGRPLHDAVTGEEVARISSTGLDFAGVLHHARDTGGSGLRGLTFHQRAALLKSLAGYLNERKEAYYALSARAGATRGDAAIDVDGGIGVLFVYASKGRRELPDDFLLPDGDTEPLGKRGTFVAQHVYSSLLGAAVQVNAFNFPVWGMLEKLAPAVLAGVPSVVKPASATAYVTERVVADIVESGILPDGALQLISGGVGDLFDHLTPQDLLSITGSAATARTLRTHPAVVGNAVRFTAEADSLNCSILGPDAAPGTREFDLYVRQLVTEMTAKAGQKCTAIRRALVPSQYLDAVADAVSAELATVVVGAPADDSVTMGALASRAQRDSVLEAVATLRAAAEPVFGDPERFSVVGADPQRGAFVPPMLLRCDAPDRREPHEVEAFGPVSTLLPYTGEDEAIAYTARGAGSLAGSVVTADPEFARRVVRGLTPWHGRFLILDRESAEESTGHGTPLPHLVHGGPGRAGGGEELGGIRSVLHHMQRTAVQGSPRMLAEVTEI